MRARYFILVLLAAVALFTAASGAKPAAVKKPATGQKPASKAAATKATTQKAAPKKAAPKANTQKAAPKTAVPKAGTQTGTPQPVTRPAGAQAGAGVQRTDTQQPTTTGQPGAQTGSQQTAASPASAGQAGAPQPAAPQSGQGSISEQVEVTREYTPDLDRSVPKLDVRPTMVDTATLRPEFTYAIRPAAYIDKFVVSPLQPIRVDVGNYDYTTPYYLKLGAGWPLSALADVHIADSNAKGYRYGLRINHLGQYGKAGTDLGGMQSALDSRSEAGVFLGREFGRSYDFRVAVDADYDLYKSYGLFALEDRPLTDYGTPDKLNYKGLNANFEVGNDFSDLSYFNFRVGGDVDLFADKLNVWENRVDAFIQIGKAFGGVHRLTLKGGVRKYFGAKDNYGVTISPRYALDLGKLDFSLGANVAVTEQKTWVFPTLLLRYDLAGGYFVPYVEIDGNYEYGDLRLTAQRNPYVESGQRVEDMGQYNLRGGIMGSLSNRLSYKLYAAANFYRGMSFFANNYTEGSTSRFIVVADNCTAYTLGGNIDFASSDRLSIRASANINAYHMDTYQKAGGLPLYDVALGAKWNLAPKWDLGLTGTLLGQRYFYVWVASDGQLRTDKVDPALDLGARLAWHHSRFITFWLEGSNLGNSRLYPYNHYRSVGVGAMAGVILSF